MISIGTLLFFTFAVIGLTHIIVDPAEIVSPFRNWVDNSNLGLLKKLFSCYQCCGVWVGFLCGFILISSNLFVVFLSGVAGSFLATWGATYLNYLEARSIINIGEGDE